MYNLRFVASVPMRNHTKLTWIDIPLKTAVTKSPNVIHDVKIQGTYINQIKGLNILYWAAR